MQLKRRAHAGSRVARSSKRAAALTAGGMLAGCSANTTELVEGAPDPSRAGKEEIFTGTCRGFCTGGCLLNCHVRDGVLVRMSAADFPNTDYNRICLKGSHPASPRVQRGQASVPDASRRRAARASSSASAGRRPFLRSPRSGRRSSPKTVIRPSRFTMTPKQRLFVPWHQRVDLRSIQEGVRHHDA